LSAITKFRAYVAASAQNACYQYIGQKRQARRRFVNSARYVLNHRAELATWNDEHGQLVCGLREWKTCSVIEPSAGPNLQTDLSAFISANAAIIEASRERPETALVVALLRFLQGPASVDELIGILIQITGVRDLEVVESDSECSSTLPELLV